MSKPMVPQTSPIRSFFSVGIVDQKFAFTALILWAGHQEKDPACKNWVIRC